MRQKTLTKEQYNANIEELDADKLEHYGRRIVPSSIVLSILSKRAGKKLNRSIIPQMCRHERLHPMGRYKNTLYFWRHEAETVSLQAEKRKEQSA